MGLYDPSSFETMHSFCNAYNKAVEKHIASKKKPAAKLDGFPVRCSRSHLKHVLQKCYNKSISDPNLLNHYEAFTPEVSLFFVTYDDTMMWFDAFLGVRRNEFWADLPNPWQTPSHRQWEQICWFGVWSRTSCAPSGSFDWLSSLFRYRKSKHTCQIRYGKSLTRIRLFKTFCHPMYHTFDLCRNLKNGSNSGCHSMERLIVNSNLCMAIS